MKFKGLKVAIFIRGVALFAGGWSAYQRRNLCLFSFNRLPDLPGPVCGG